MVTSSFLKPIISGSHQPTRIPNSYSYCFSVRHKNRYMAKSRGPKGLQLEVGVRRAPRLLLMILLSFLETITAGSHWWSHNLSWKLYLQHQGHIDDHIIFLGNYICRIRITMMITLITLIIAFNICLGNYFCNIRIDWIWFPAQNVERSA